MAVTDEQIVARLRQMLETVDLQVTTGTPMPLPTLAWRRMRWSEGERAGTVTNCAHCISLSTNAEKMLRKKLEEELGEDLSEKKALIRSQVLGGQRARGEVGASDPRVDERRFVCPLSRSRCSILPRQ